MCKCEVAAHLNLELRTNSQSIWEEYRELVHNDIPALSFFPLVCEISDVEKEQLDRGVIVRKDFSVTGIFSQLSVKAFDGVCGVDDFSQLYRILEESC